MTSPYLYWMSECGCVELHHGDFRDVAPHFTKRGSYIGDPPYGRDTHNVARGQLADGANRKADLGFGHLDPLTRRALAREMARLVDRWALVFSDQETAVFWRLSMLAARPSISDTIHLEEERRLFRLLHDDYDVDLNDVAQGVFDYNVRCEWVKVGCAPSFNGNGPAEGTEPFTVCHRKLTVQQRKKWQEHRRWNAGGKRGVYTHPIDRVDRNDAVTTPKPLPLILELVLDFTEPGETIYDLTSGGGTLGAAVLAANQAKPNLPPRRAVLVEVREAACAWTKERLTAVAKGSTVRAARSGQGVLF